MKEFCICDRAMHNPHRNPWCDLLENVHSFSCEVLHLWYKLEWLRKEVDKRSAYLGKFRRTEEAKHLLDLINMTVDEYDLFIPFAKAAMADVFDALLKYVPKHEQTCFWREGKNTAVFTDDQGLPNPAVSFYKGQYVEYNGDLYIAVDDGDSDDVVGKLEPTEDFRESIHYGLIWRCDRYNRNVVEPLDTAIFEALVARIIYKWLMYAYPDEASHYLTEWDEYMEKIKKWCYELYGTRIVHRIPRHF